MRQKTTIIATIPLAVLLAGGVLFLFASSGSAVEAETQVDGLNIYGESANGQVDDIVISGSGEVSWTGMPDNLSRLEVKIQVKSGNAWETFASHLNTSIQGREGSYRFSNVKGSVLSETSLNSDDFSVDEDGRSRTQFIRCRVLVTIVADNGTSETLSDTHRIEASVVNLPESGVTGETNINGSIDMNETK